MFDIFRVALLLCAFLSAYAEEHVQTYRGEANVGDIFYMISVNFLLYVTLIVVFYMLVRFYLEEETDAGTSYVSYSTVPQDDSDMETEGAGVEMGVTTLLETEVDASEDENILKKDESIAKPAGIKRVGSFLNVNEWVESEGTRMEVIQKVVFCAVGLNVSFGIWGLVQERMLTYPYDGEYFVYSYGLVFLNRLGGLVLSTCLLYYYKVEWVSTPLYEFSFPAVANMLSSWCQYEALKYVTFPTQMLAKAFKVVPVMLMGKFINDKSYESYEYVCASTIGFGIYLFISSSESIDFKQNVFGNPEGVNGTWCGIVLLILFLFFDSFTAQWQTRMFTIKKEMSPLQMMLVINAFSSAFSFITLVHQEELYVAMSFVYAHPIISLHMLIFTICSTVGQLYIFYTVKNFGAVVFSIIMSMRILLSVLLSCLVYSHPVTELGVVGIVVVFGAITYRIMRKTEGKALLRWKNEEKESARNVLKEWHEHLDI